MTNGSPRWVRRGVSSRILQGIVEEYFTNILAKIWVTTQDACEAVCMRNRGKDDCSIKRRKRQILQTSNGAMRVAAVCGVQDLNANSKTSSSTSQTSLKTSSSNSSS